MSEFSEYKEKEGTEEVSIIPQSIKVGSKRGPEHPLNSSLIASQLSHQPTLGIT